MSEFKRHTTPSCERCEPRSIGRSSESEASAPLDTDVTRGRSGLRTPFLELPRPALRFVENQWTRPFPTIFASIVNSLLSVWQ